MNKISAYIIKVNKLLKLQNIINYICFKSNNKINNNWQ